MLRLALIVLSVVVTALTAVIQGIPIPDGTVISTGGGGYGGHPVVISQQSSPDRGLLGLGKK